MDARACQFDVRRDGTGKLCNVSLPRERRGRGARGSWALGGTEAPPRAEVQGRMSPDPLQKALGPAGPLLPIAAL